MVNWQTVQYVAIGVILVSTILTSVYAWVIAPSHGRRRWTGAVWAVYGVALAAYGLWSVHVALFCVGLLVPLLSHNALQLWSARVLGDEGYRVQLARLLSEGGRAGYVGAVALSLAIRSTIGVVLVMGTESRHPIAWLGYGVLASALPAFGAALRLAFWPPPAPRVERKVGNLQGARLMGGGVEHLSGPQLSSKDTSVVRPRSGR
jgi:hypothetical protein